jgi:hypothetical protein
MSRKEGTCRYLTANLTKILVLVRSAAKPAAGGRLADDIAALCGQLERAYKHAAGNPFHTPGTVRAQLEASAWSCLRTVLRAIAAIARGELSRPSRECARSALCSLTCDIAAPGCVMADAGSNLQAQRYLLAVSQSVDPAHARRVQMLESARFKQHVTELVKASITSSSAPQAGLAASALM